MNNISVVVRTHNRADVLGECLEAILRQDYVKFEIVVVDDHSTDNTRDVVDTFKANAMFERHNCDEIRHIMSDGKGRAAARNTGVRAAKYDIVAFCDDDTIIEEINWLSIISRELSKGEIDAIGFTYYYPPEFRSPLWTLFSRLNHEIGPKIFALALKVEATSLGGGCGAINKRIIDELGYWNEKVIRAEDLDYGVRFLRAGFKKKNIDGMMIIHKHHRVKRTGEEGHFNKEYEWMKTMLNLVDKTNKNKVVILAYISYRFFIHLGFCVATRSLKPLDMSQGNIKAFRAWIGG